MSATNAMSIAEMFSTSVIPCEAPVAAASMKLALVLLDLHLHGPHRDGALRLRPQDLRDEERARRRHDRGGDQVLERRAHRARTRA